MEKRWLLLLVDLCALATILSTYFSALKVRKDPIIDALKSIYGANV